MSSTDAKRMEVFGTYPGMTMRQAYKLAALQGLLASPKDYKNGDGTTATKRNEIVSIAGFYADAMLAEDAEHTKKEVSP